MLAKQTITNLKNSGFNRYDNGIYWHSTNLLGIKAQEDLCTVISIEDKELLKTYCMNEAIWFSIDLLAGAPAPTEREYRSLIKENGRVRTNDLIIKRFLKYLKK